MARANTGVPPDKNINFRIGVHIGDVMVRAGDLFGDGVNIAARLQTLAKPGGVCISGATYDQVRKVLPITSTDLGAQRVKNIQEPIKVYQVDATSGAREAASAPLAETESAPPLPDKPSIAILPFQNMSGDPEQEYCVAEARETAARLLEVDPNFSISAFIARGGQSNAKLMIEGLQKAGLPE